MSLARFSRRSLESGEKQYGILLHDLHLKHCRDVAAESGVTAVWHRRLLDGLAEKDLGENAPAPASNFGNGTLDVNVFADTPRPWWKDDGNPGSEVENRDYIRGNVMKHLQSAGFEIEMAATVLDLRWMLLQVQIGGMLALRSDFQTVQDSFTDERSSGARDSMKYILLVLEENASIFQKGIRVLSFVLFSNLFDLAKKDEFLSHFLNYVKEVTPKPFLEPVVCRHRMVRNVWKRTSGFRHPDGKDAEFCTADFSSCKKYMVYSSKHSAIVFDLESTKVLGQRSQLSDVGPVKFNPKDSSQVIFCTGSTIHV